jgi:arylsulfatase
VEIDVKVDWPILTIIRLDPFERTGMPSGDKGSLAYYNWFAYQFQRFVYVQQQVEKLAETALELPPMQKGASFNLEVIKEQIARKMAAENQ